MSLHFLAIKYGKMLGIISQKRIASKSFLDYYKLNIIECHIIRNREVNVTNKRNKYTVFQVYC